MKLVVRCMPLVLAAAVAHGSTPPGPNVTGEYASNWDDVRLVQQGNEIRGTYVCCGGGTIDGRIYEGRIIRYQWRQPDGHGEGVWEITASGRLEGTWGWSQSDSDGGRWDLVSKAALAN